MCSFQTRATYWRLERDSIQLSPLNLILMVYQLTTLSLLKWLQHLSSMFWIKMIRLIPLSHCMLYTQMASLVLVHRLFGKWNQWLMLQTTLSNIALSHFMSSRTVKFYGKSWFQFWIINSTYISLKSLGGWWVLNLVIPAFDAALE